MTATKKRAARIEIDAGVRDAAAAAADGRGTLIIERLAERFGAHAGARATFGDPIERDGVTVVPVARSMWGSGAGSGESEEDGVGAGGGGGAWSRPLGFIEIGPAGARFVPLQAPWQDVRLVLAYAFAAWLLARALRRLLAG